MCWRANIAGVQRNRARPPRPGTPQRASRAHRLQWLPGFGIGGKAAEFTEACAAYPRFGCGCSSGVEHNLAKVGVVGSNPIARSKNTSYLKLSFGQELFRLAFDPEKPGESVRDVQATQNRPTPQLAGSIKLAQKSKQGHRLRTAFGSSGTVNVCHQAGPRPISRKTSRSSTSRH